MSRFNHNADTSAEARQYLKYRMKELLRFKAELTELHTLDTGDVVAVIAMDGEVFISAYLLESNRGKGAYAGLIAEAQKLVSSFSPRRVLTVLGCDLVDYLHDKGIPYCAIDTYKMDGKVDSLESDNHFIEYALINLFWKNKVAKRTSVPYMLHVDEGLRVIEEGCGTDRAMRIYALHGLLQQCYEQNTLRFPGLELVAPDVLIGAMEYREVANAHLAHHDPSTLRLSQDPDVNMALVADKVQNRKDFERFHKGTHKRSDALDAYFKRWLEALNVAEDEYAYLSGIISIGD